MPRKVMPNGATSAPVAIFNVHEAMLPLRKFSRGRVLSKTPSFLVRRLLQLAMAESWANDDDPERFEPREVIADLF